VGRAAPSLDQVQVVSRLGIMQPYFFPYLGYFQLIHAVDRWVILDNVQNIRRGWISRNRILDPLHDWTYLTIPVRKHHLDTLIKDVMIGDLPSARARILGQLNVYKGRAPYFAETVDFVRRCLSFDVPTLARLNGLVLEKCCELLGLPFDHHFASELEARATSSAPSDRRERLFWLGETLEAKVHIYPPGARELYDKADFASRGFELWFLHPEEIHYEQGGRPFVPNLSIIDVLMWNSVGDVKALLDRYSLE